MKYGIFTIPLSSYPEDLKNFDKIYAFSENTNEYWYSHISKKEVEYIKEKKISNRNIEIIINKLRFKKVKSEEKSFRYNNDLITFFENKQKNHKVYFYDKKNHKVGEENQSISNLYHKSYFIGEYKINNKLEKFKNIFIDYYTKINKKSKIIIHKIKRKIIYYNPDLFGIFIIDSDDFFRIYAINERKEVYISYINKEENFKDINNKSLQKKIYNLKFEIFDHDTPMIDNIINSKKKKNIEYFKYDLFKINDLVYEGMGHFGYYIGNYYIDNKKEIKEKIKNF